MENQTYDLPTLASRSYQDRSRMVAAKSGWKTSERQDKERSEHHMRVSKKSNEDEETEMYESIEILPLCST